MASHNTQLQNAACVVVGWNGGGLAGGEMTSCPHCQDSTNHESDEALCKCIALLGGWKHKYLGVGRPSLFGPTTKYWFNPDGERIDEGPPDYLTDPAKGMRMLEWLLENASDSVFMICGLGPFERQDDNYAIITERGPGGSAYIKEQAESRVSEQGKTPQHAITRAYHALKLSEKEEKDENPATERTR